MCDSCIAHQEWVDALYEAHAPVYMRSKEVEMTPEALGNVLLLTIIVSFVFATIAILRVANVVIRNIKHKKEE
jgi:hypothetical protein